MNTRVLRRDADFCFHAAQKLQGLLRLLGFVALVVLPENFVARGFHHHRFHGGRTDVEPHQELRMVVVRLLIRRGRDLSYQSWLSIVVRQMLVHSISPITFKRGK